MELDETIRRKLYISFIVVGIFFPLCIFLFLQFFFIKSFAKANIMVRTTQITAPLNRNLRIGNTKIQASDSADFARSVIATVPDLTQRAAAEKIYRDLDGYRVKVEGEGDFVRAISTRTKTKYSLLLVNYDKQNKNKEVVPVTFTELPNGDYELRITTVGGDSTGIETVSVQNGLLKKLVFMKPNQITVLKLHKEN